jgi:4-hydroxy-3-methylbut-2-en-1-yl diphosphate reductase
VLRSRFPAIEAPKREDICYATTNRQRAVKALLPVVDLLLVIGSVNSSNSRRLVEVASAAGVDARLVEDAASLDESWFEGTKTVGLTSGASAPERLVREVVRWFRERGVDEVREVGGEAEDVAFRLPAELRRRPVAA